MGGRRCERQRLNVSCMKWWGNCSCGWNRQDLKDADAALGARMAIDAYVLGSAVTLTHTQHCTPKKVISEESNVKSWKRRSFADWRMVSVCGSMPSVPFLKRRRRGRLIWGSSWPWLDTDHHAATMTSGLSRLMDEDLCFGGDGAAPRTRSRWSDYPVGPEHAFFKDSVVSNMYANRWWYSSFPQ